MSKKLTIQRIAELADVSKATVSRVLNEYPHVRPELRDKVQKIISDTGYQPNNIARLLASDRSSIIGMFISSDAQMVFNDPYFPALTESISRGAAGNDLILSLFVSYSPRQGRDTLSAILAAGIFDGLVLTADHKGSSFVSQLRAADIPFVYLGRPDDADSIHYVDADNGRGGYLAASHLISLGHRRVATVASNENSAGTDRVEGYRRALVEYGLPFDEALVAYGDYTVESGYQGMKALIEQKPDAVFVASDTMALGALRALREANLRVPEDIAMVSYDDLPPAIQADPPLTTVRQPIAKTGELAVETLVQVISNRDKMQTQQIVLPVELVIRESCGAAH